MGGGGEYSYIRVLPDEFLLKLTLMTADFKRNSSAEQEDMNIPPPPFNALVAALNVHTNILFALCLLISTYIYVSVLMKNLLL